MMQPRSIHNISGPGAALLIFLFLYHTIVNKTVIAHLHINVENVANNVAPIRARSDQWESVGNMLIARLSTYMEMRYSELWQRIKMKTRLNTLSLDRVTYV